MLRQSDVSSDASIAVVCRNKWCWKRKYCKLSAKYRPTLNIDALIWWQSADDVSLFWLIRCRPKEVITWPSAYDSFLLLGQLESTRATLFIASWYSMAVSGKYFNVWFKPELKEQINEIMKHSPISPQQPIRRESAKCSDGDVTYKDVVDVYCTQWLSRRQRS